MSPAQVGCSVAFIWRPEEVHSGLAQMACRTGTVALVDISGLTLDLAHNLFSKLDTSAVHVMVSPETFMAEGFESWLADHDIGGVWVHFHPFLTDVNLHSFIQRLKAGFPRRRCFPVLTEVDLILQVVAEAPDFAGIVLKGCEASGFTSGESTFILYSAVRDIFNRKGLAPKLLVWGGIATAKAASAFLSTGAAGIVLESVHWLTDMAGGDHAFRRRIGRLQPDHTELIGRDLQVPCRLFNRGNSTAVRELKSLAASMVPGVVTEQQRQAFAAHVQQHMVHPAQSRFQGQEIIPLSVEASFARSFVARYGAETESAINAFKAHIRELCSEAGASKQGFLPSLTAQRMGLRYPFIQGAMTWITDVVAFATAVADAGALPTLALGLMDRVALEQKLSGLREVMQGRPYAVNVLALPENPFLDVQLDWIKENRPPFVVIAAGSPSHVVKIEECGCTPVYVAPNEDLLRMAFQAGAHYVICEGNEAGGHLGSYSTLTFAQRVDELRRNEPDLFRNRAVILAGGIWNGDTVCLAALLGADAVQMGTAYLGTAEIVQTGALTELYQRRILTSPWGGTAITGAAWGMPVRSLISPKIEAIQAMESAFIRENPDSPSFRNQLEQLTAGSLLIAARGVDRPGGIAVSEEFCLDQGQFMSGACAAALDQVKSLKDFHEELVRALEEPVQLPQLSREATAENTAGRGEGARPMQPSQGFGLSFRRREDHLEHRRERIAITGMSLANSLGSNPEEVWSASMAMKSGITEVPPSRWDHRLLYDPRPLAQERTYCRVGAFKEIDISRKELGISPHDFRTMSKATRETLDLARKAIGDAGILNSAIPRERIAVLVSQNAGEFAANLEDIIIRVCSKKILDCVKKAVPLSAEMEAAIEKEVRAGRRAIDDTTLVGRLNAAAVGFICRKYGFMGPSYAVSAACATSLAALYCAVQMIRNGIIDAAVVGGGEEDLTPVHFLEFSALGVLAGLSGLERPPHETLRPFDAARDGTVLGEGGGMLVIERESVALARGAEIHAYLTGMGASNNHLGLVEPSCLTQEMAIRSSFLDVGTYGPADVELVECHATGTVQGDLEEIKALKNVFAGQGRTFLTSFKSQIGHTLGASGINSLIRGVMAMKGGAFPPTLNCDDPDQELKGEDVGLSLSREPSDWKTRNGAPRRLQVNAFGFGGSNYVAQIEESRESSAILLGLPEGQANSPTKSDASDADSGGLFLAGTTIDGELYRVAVIAPNLEKARARIQDVTEDAGASPLSEKKLRRLARKGIHLSLAKEPPPPLAFVFPGQGSQYPGMGQGLYETVPTVREGLDRLASEVEFDLLHFLFCGSEEELRNTRWLQPALFCLEYVLARYMLSLGVRPATVAGHSLGEFTAFCLAGVCSFEDGLRLVDKRAQCMERATSLHEDAGTMLAVNAPAEFVEQCVTRLQGVTISNINAPNQIVVAGRSDKLSALSLELSEKQYRSTLLNVGMAFHSPLMSVIRGELEDFVTSISFQAPRIPVISNVTGEPFPSDPEAIKKLVIAHLESPVRWAESVQCLRNTFKIGVFVEIGPGDVLSNLIGETLAEVKCIPTCIPSKEDRSLTNALARLYVCGFLGDEHAAKFMSFSASHTSSGSEKECTSRYRPQAEAACHVPLSSPDSLRAKTARRQSPETEETCSVGVVEDLIAIIMEATGYERDEMDPDMDLREELSIRSSRLPVIMDAAERHFGIAIQFEDFLGVRTIRDMAVQVSRLLAGGQGEKAQHPITASELSRGKGSKEAVRADREDLKRLVFDEISLDMGRFLPVELTAGDTVAILGAGKPSRLSNKLGDLFRRDHGLGTEYFAYLKKVNDWSLRGFDLRNEEEARAAAAGHAELPSLAGLVFVVDEVVDKRIKGPDDLSNLLRGFFLLLQGFLKSSAGRFVFLVTRREDTRGLAGVLAEGALGMYLGAALEHGSVQFRTLTVDGDTDLSYALRCALDRSRQVVEMIHRDGEAFTSAGRLAPLTVSGEPDLLLAPGDVVILSGGGQGITSHLARSLIPFSPRLMLLGRTSLDGVPQLDGLLKHRNPDEVLTLQPMLQAKEGFAEEESSAQIARTARSLEIVGLLKELRDSGLEAEYRSCDVTDRKQVETLVRDTVARYGRVSGIVHGAGAIRDGLLTNLTSSDFSAVADVKILGAWHLFKAAQEHGLKFFTVLSSVVAAQGNFGQGNYCAANRAVSALVKTLGRNNGRVRCTSLLLPPIEGAGMADDPEIRKVLRMKGMEDAYIHVKELKELFCLELFMARADDSSVLFMRKLPKVPTARLDAITPTFDKETLQIAAAEFERQDFPLIDSVAWSDLGKGTLEAHRTFSTEKDLWIEDHKPFKFLRQPVLSGVMVLEAFMEVARLLYPYLRVRGIQKVQFLERIDCPTGVDRHTVVSCRRMPSANRHVVCEAALSAQNSPPLTGEQGRMRLSHKGRVILTGDMEDGWDQVAGFPVLPSELDTPPVDGDRVLQLYEERSDFEGRYRVLSYVEGTGAEVIRGRTIYREQRDFSAHPVTHYQYSPYLLEAVFHLVACHMDFRSESSSRPMVPFEIEELMLGRKANHGEELLLEARITGKDESGVIWNARCLDEHGRMLMQIRGLRMHWISG